VDVGFITCFLLKVYGGKMGCVEELAREYLRLAEEVYKSVQSGEAIPSYSRVREALWLLQLGFEGVVKELERIAGMYGGCVSCCYSTPYPDHLSLLSRGCKLGLRQDTCKRWTPLLNRG